VTPSCEEQFKRVVAERLSGGPPEALDREVELPLAPNEVVTVTGARRAGKTYLLFSTINNWTEAWSRMTKYYTPTSRTQG